MNTREREVMDALATALRDARDSVAGELALERAAFKGYEGSSNIAQLEAELVAIDSALAAYDALLAAGMNTREREVMDAAAELCRQVIGMLDVPARHRDEANSLLERINALLAEGSASSEEGAVAPIDMLLFCPRCHTQHVDGEESEVEWVENIPAARTITWDNPPHRSHLCHACGCIWRPADVATNGVAKIATRGKADTWDATAEQPSCGQDARDAPKHGDDAGDGLRYIMCKVGFGEHYGRWLLIPHADGQYVTAAKLEPFSMSILEHQLIAAQQQGGAA